MIKVVIWFVLAVVNTYFFLNNIASNEVNFVTGFSFFAAIIAVIMMFVSVGELE